MKGLIINYRGGRRTHSENQMVVELEGVKSRADTAKLMGARVVWKTPSGKEIVGKVARPHGSKGAVVCRFNRGLPGQSMGTTVEVTEKA